MSVWPGEEEGEVELCTFDICLSAPVEPYNVTFYVGTAQGLHDFDRQKLSEYDKMQRTEVTSIVTLVNGRDLRLYVPPEAKGVAACNGWVDEFAELLDGATTITTFNGCYQYGALRKYLPFEQRMIYWQLCTFDLCKIIRGRTKDWVSLRDFLWHNSLDGQYQIDGTAATRFYQRKMWGKSIEHVIAQAQAVQALGDLVASKHPHHTIFHPHSEFHETSPGTKQKITTIAQIDLHQEFHSLFPSAACAQEKILPHPTDGDCKTQEQENLQDSGSHGICSVQISKEIPEQVAQGHDCS